MKRPKVGTQHKPWKVVSNCVEFFSRGRNSAGHNYAVVEVRSCNRLVIDEGDNEWYVDGGKDKPLLVIRHVYRNDGVEITGTQAEKGDNYL